MADAEAHIIYHVNCMWKDFEVEAAAEGRKLTTAETGQMLEWGIIGDKFTKWCNLEAFALNRVPSVENAFRARAHWSPFNKIK
jgi:hypothetical protein